MQTSQVPPHQTRQTTSLCILIGSVLQANAMFSMLILLACFTQLQLKFSIEHVDMRLACSCSAMETHFM